MKTLPSTFKKGGFVYTIIKRIGMTAIYEQKRNGFKHYEVGHIRTNKARDAFGKHFEASESWPTSEEWGVRAWTYQLLSDAEQRLVSIQGQNG